MAGEATSHDLPPAGSGLPALPPKTDALPVPELANRILRVIVSKDEPKRVVTAHLDRKTKGKL
jgi:hypothetical protein